MLPSQGADDAGKFRVIRHNVPSCPGVKRTDGNNAPFLREGTRERYQRGDHFRSRRKRVDSPFPLRAVGALSGQRNVKGIRGGVKFPVTDADASGGKLRRNVAAEHGVHALQRSRVDHALRAAVSLLVRLKEKHHPARQLRAMRREQLRRAQRGRHVNVMAAGVHHAGNLGGILRSGRLLQRQRVHIRANGSGLPFPRPGQHTDNRRIQQPPCGDAAFPQPRFDPFRSFKFMIPQFRMAVKRLSQRKQFTRKLPRLSQVIRHMRNLISSAKQPLKPSFPLSARPFS